MTYHGDVYDTPPRWIRVLLGLCCLFGAVVMLSKVLLDGMFIESLLTIAGLILAVYLVSSLETGAKIAIATIGYWALLLALVLLMPLE